MRIRIHMWHFLISYGRENPEILPGKVPQQSHIEFTHTPGACQLDSRMFLTLPRVLSYAARGCALTRVSAKMAEELVCRSTSSTVINCNNRQLHDVSCLEKDEKSCDCILVSPIFLCSVELCRKIFTLCRFPQELHLCFNYITGVPAETLAVYSRLTHLSLACNNLTSLPPSLQMCCPQLRRLCVANNRVSVIENVEGLLHLECLDLRCNRIRCVDNIMNLSNLKE